MLTLLIIGEPVPWSVPLVLRTGVSIKKPKLRQWQELIRLQTVSQLPNDWEKWDCPICVKRFIVRRTRPKSNKCAWPAVYPDLDNCMKGFFDALEGLVYTNDSRIVHIISAQKIWATDEHPAGIEAQFEPYKESKRWTV